MLSSLVATARSGTVPMIPIASSPHETTLHTAHSRSQFYHWFWGQVSTHFLENWNPALPNRATQVNLLSNVKWFNNIASNNLEENKSRIGIKQSDSIAEIQNDTFLSFIRDLVKRFCHSATRNTYDHAYWRHLIFIFCNFLVTSAWHKNSIDSPNDVFLKQ